MEKNPSFVEAYYHSALIAEALGDTKRALEYLDKVDGCVRSAMTTVSEEQICELKERLLSGEGENNG